MKSFAGIFSSNQECPKKKSWFSKKRIFPIDCGYSEPITKSRVTGLKLSTPFLIIVLVAIIAACA
jgi:hypothetical protein